MSDQYDYTRCKVCGGKCCKIYDESIKDPSVDWYEWVAKFHANFRNYSVKERYNAFGHHLFKPNVHDIFTSEWKDELISFIRYYIYFGKILLQGINPKYCEYHDRTVGCILPYHERPRVCREYICEQWEKELEYEEENNIVSYPLPQTT